MNDNTKKVFTLKTTCKKCHGDFTYLRTEPLTGAPRTICDACKPKKRGALLRLIISEE